MVFSKTLPKYRIFNFLDPERDTSNTGYQAMQAKIAIGSGKVFGRGLFEGVQTQYNYIPEKQTDFIFAVIGEELGLIGGLILILLYFLLLYRLFKIAKNSKDTFGSLMVTGFAAMFLIHIWENIGDHRSYAYNRYSTSLFKLRRNLPIGKFNMYRHCIKCRSSQRGA